MMESYSYRINIRACEQHTGGPSAFGWGITCREAPLKNGNAVHDNLATPEVEQGDTTEPIEHEVRGLQVLIDARPCSATGELPGSFEQLQSLDNREDQPKCLRFGHAGRIVPGENDLQ